MPLNLGNSRVKRRKNDPRTVPNRKTFYKTACALIESNLHRVHCDRRATDPITGFERDIGPSKEYWLWTTGGLLKVVVHDDWVHTCFDKPKEAKAAGCWAFTTILPGFDANPYSGKWNFHWFHGDPVEYLKANLVYGLEKVVLKGEEAEAALVAAIAQKKADDEARWARIEAYEAEQAAASAG